MRISLSHSVGVQKHPVAIICCPYKFSRSGTVDEYVVVLEEKLCDGRFSSVTCAEDNWKMLQSCITALAEESIGKGFCSNPEWFEDSYTQLKPLIDKKNNAHWKFLQVGTRLRRRTFKKLQRMVQEAVFRAKENWFNKVAAKGEAAKRDGQDRWGSICRL